MKKSTKTIFVTALSILMLGAGLTWWMFTRELGYNKPCAFCNPTVLKTHTFYEDDFIRGLCSHKPIQPWHCLVVIKRHIQRFEQASDKEICAIGRLLKKINKAIQKINGPSSYLLLQKNGKEVGQTVPHVHVHYIPKKKTERKATAVFGLLWSFIFSIFQQPMSQENLAKHVTIMRNAL